MKRSILLFFVIFFTLILLLGCNKQSSNVETDFLLPINKVEQAGKSEKKYTGKTVQQGLEDYLNENARDNKKAENLNIISTYNIEHGMLIFAKFSSTGKEYTGMFQTEQTKSEEIKNIIGSVCEITNTAAFTKQEMSGESSIKGEPKKLYMFVGGAVNDNKIRSLNILFDDNSLVNVKVTDNNTYSYAKTDGFYAVKSIEGIDSNDNIVYSIPQQSKLQK